MLHCIHVVHSDVNACILVVFHFLEKLFAYLQTEKFFTVEFLSGILHIFHAYPQYCCEKPGITKIHSKLKKKRSNVQINYLLPKYLAWVRSGMFFNLTLSLYQLNFV